MTISGTFHSEYAGRIYFSSSDSGNLVIHFAIRAYKHSKRTILVLFARHPQLKCLNIGTQSARRGLHPGISFLLFLIVFYDLVGGPPRLVLEGASRLGGPPMASKGGPRSRRAPYLTSEGGPSLGGPRAAIRFFKLFLEEAPRLGGPAHDI